MTLRMSLSYVVEAFWLWRAGQGVKAVLNALSKTNVDERVAGILLVVLADVIAKRSRALVDEVKNAGKSLDP